MSVKEPPRASRGAGEVARRYRPCISMTLPTGRSINEIRADLGEVLAEAAQARIHARVARARAQAVRVAATQSLQQAREAVAAARQRSIPIIAGRTGRRG